MPITNSHTEHYAGIDDGAEAVVAIAPRRPARGPRGTVRLAGLRGYSLQVGADVYALFARTLRRVLPEEGPGLTRAEIARRMIERLPGRRFADADQVRWLADLVHRDLAARALLVREPGRPGRWLRRRRAQPTMPICQGTNSLSPSPRRSLAVD